MLVDLLHVLRRSRPASSTIAGAQPLAGSFSLLLGLTLLVTAAFAVIHGLDGQWLPALVTVIGSEFLAVGVIAHSSHQRFAMAQALDEARAAAVGVAATRAWRAHEAATKRPRVACGRRSSR